MDLGGNDERLSDYGRRIVERRSTPFADILCSRNRLRGGGIVVCIIIGCNKRENAIGRVPRLSPIDLLKANGTDTGFRG